MRGVKCNGRWLFILSRWLFRSNHLLRRLLIGWKRKAMIEYRNKYREGGDCLDIEDRGWVVQKPRPIGEVDTESKRGLLYLDNYQRAGVCLCFTSLQQRGHLEMASPFTVPCKREARFLHHSNRESSPGLPRGSPLHYRCTTVYAIANDWLSALDLAITLDMGHDGWANDVTLSSIHELSLFTLHFHLYKNTKVSMETP